MAILKVAQMGHPVLRLVAEPVPRELITGDAVQAFLQDMRETCAEYDGMGLAAPQVHQSVRIVLLTADVLGGGLTALINPVITPLGDEYVRTYEGCLSVEGMRAAVDRVARIRVQALDDAGRELDFEAEDMDAIVIQHECDHLDGVLYIDRCDPRTLAFLSEYRRYGPLDELFEQLAAGEE